MKNLIKLLCVYITMILSLTYITFFSDGKLKLMYEGIGYQDNLFIEFNYFIMFFCYIMFIFGEAEFKSIDYGIYIVTRTGSRKKLFYSILINVVKKVLLLEGTKIITFICLSEILIGKIDIALNDCIYIARFLIVITFILAIYSIFEIYYSVSALMYILVMYLSLLVLGKYLYILLKDNLICGVLNSLLIPNYLMGARVDINCKLIGVSSHIAYGIFCGIIAFGYIIIYKTFQKKDFM